MPLSSECPITVSRFAAGILSGSSAMLSEGIHSVVDTGNELLLLFGIHRSKKPAGELPRGSKRGLFSLEGATAERTGDGWTFL